MRTVVRDTGSFHTRLVMALTELDQRESKRDWSIYRIGHYLRAAQDVTDAIERGADPEDAFAENFTPTRGMHRIAKQLSLGLTVDQGRWVRV